MKIEIGQKLYYEVTDNRDRPTGEIKELTVSKIGNKYFYCNNNSEYKYDLITLRFNHKDYSSCDRQLYVAMELIEEKNERIRLLNEVQSFFSSHTKPKKLSVMQLTQIWDIINEYDKDGMYKDIQKFVPIADN